MHQGRFVLHNFLQIPEAIMTLTTGDVLKVVRDA